jgi:hypothetical protein
MTVVVRYVVGDEKTFTANRIVLDGSVLRLYGTNNGGADTSIPIHMIECVEIDG